MNEIEAKEYLKDEYKNYEKVIGHLQFHKEHSGYPSEEQALSLAISALEKQIPKKPKEYEDKYYACKCGNVLLLKWLKYPTELMPKSEGLSFCLCCGQKLDWSVEE